MSRASRGEIIIELAGAAWLAVSAAVLLVVSFPALGLPIGACGGTIAGMATLRLLRTVGSPEIRIATFPLRAWDWIQEDACFDSDLLLDREMQIGVAELQLSAAEMIRPAEAWPSILLLDDVLARPEAGSRVVRLFDPARIPTPGELKSRIDRHLGQGERPVPQPQPQDDSQALYDALADLRRSLG